MGNLVRDLARFWSMLVLKAGNIKFGKSLMMSLRMQGSGMFAQRLQELRSQRFGIATLRSQ
ncbi:hypothetical protein [Nostoc sp.]|uniref:hypothetical protein n=1 Tax=Nostoc sp. TaxID=1180 RepID=UPI002FF8F8E1